MAANSNKSRLSWTAAAAGFAAAVTLFLSLDPVVKQNNLLWVRIAIPAFLALGIWGTVKGLKMLRAFGWIGIAYYLLGSTGFAFPPEISWDRDVSNSSISAARLLCVWGVGIGFVVAFAQARLRAARSRS